MFLRRDSNSDSGILLDKNDSLNVPLEIDTKKWLMLPIVGLLNWFLPSPDDTKQKFPQLLSTWIGFLPSQTNVVCVSYRKKKKKV